MTTCTPASGCCPGPHCSGCGWSRRGRSSRQAASRAGGWGRWRPTTKTGSCAWPRRGRTTGSRPTRPRTSSAPCSTRSPTPCREPHRRPSGAHRCRDRTSRTGCANGSGATPSRGPSCPSWCGSRCGWRPTRRSWSPGRCGWCSRSTTSRTPCTSATPGCCGPPTSASTASATGRGPMPRSRCAGRPRPGPRSTGCWSCGSPTRSRWTATSSRACSSTASPPWPPGGSTCSGRGAWAAS